MLRLILALLLAFGATPALAVPSCHDRTITAAHHGGMPDRDRPAVPEHSCIGCMPVSDWDGARIVPPAPVAAPAPAMRVPALPLLPGQAPTPPPPRRA